MEANICRCGTYLRIREAKLVNQIDNDDFALAELANSMPGLKLAKLMSLVAQIPVSVRKDEQAGTYGNRIMLMSAPIFTDVADPASGGLVRDADAADRLERLREQVADVPALSDSAPPTREVLLGVEPDFVYSPTTYEFTTEQGFASIEQLAEVAERTGLTRAATRRFLLTLSDLGFVRANGRLFSLTPRVLELGYAYLSSQTLPELAEPHLERLVAEVHESSSVSVLDGGDVVYVVDGPVAGIVCPAVAVEAQEEDQGLRLQHGRGLGFAGPVETVGDGGQESLSHEDATEGYGNGRNGIRITLSGALAWENVETRRRRAPSGGVAGARPVRRGGRRAEPFLPGPPGAGTSGRNCRGKVS